MVVTQYRLLVVSLRMGLTEYLDEMVRFQGPRMESGSG